MLCLRNTVLYQPKQDTPPKTQTNKQDPFIDYPTNGQHANKYTIGNIKNLNKKDVDDLQFDHPKIYQNLQSYLLNKHSQLHNHCMNITGNRAEIMVWFLFFLFVLLLPFFCIYRHS